MGLLEALLGQQNPVAQWAGNNSSLLAALGAGIASGPNFGQGLSNAAQLVPQARAMDTQTAEKTKADAKVAAQENATQAWLKANYPQYANLPVNEGFQLALKDMTSQQKPATTADITNFNFAKQNGFTGSFQEWLQQGASGSDTTPAPVKEWQYFTGLTPDQQRQYLTMKRANPYLDIGTGFVQPNPVDSGQPNGPVITKNNQQAGFDTQLGKNKADWLTTNQGNAQDAAKSLQSAQQAQQLLDSNGGIITGFGANFKLGFGKLLQQAGYHGADDAIANTEAFVATRAQEVGRLIKMFGAGTGLSDADREFATKAAAGSIDLTEASIRKILDINQRAAQNVLDSYNRQVQQTTQNGMPDMVIPNPVAPAAGGSVDDILKKYGL